MLRRRDLLCLGTASALSVASAAARARVVHASLGGPSRHYDHAALGSTEHPTVLRVEFSENANAHSLTYSLPTPFVFEDRLVRLADVDGDGIDELIVVRSSPEDGARLAVYRITSEGGRFRLVQSALGPPAGAHRWMNPVGAAGFIREGALQIASVVTPHIGGSLRLYRYSPPDLPQIAGIEGVCNHVFGRSEQHLSVIVPSTEFAGGPVVVVPDQSRTRLRQLAFDSARGWHDAARPVGLPSPVAQVKADGSRVRVMLDDGSELKVSLG